jgi:uncharacterized protein YndB with AHSA1/START domain
MTDPAEAPLGRLEQRDGVGILHYRRRLAQPLTRVWQALSDPDHLTAWFPTTIDGDRRAGAALVFEFPDLDLEPMHGVMMIYDPPVLMELMWGEDRLRFELMDEGDVTVLDLTVTFPQYGKAARDGAGWHACLDNLDRQVIGQQPRTDQWPVIHPRYVASFGPEASSIGPPQEWLDRHGSSADLV